MTSWLILRLTIGQLARQRRTLVLVLLVLLPVGVALLFQLTDDNPTRNATFAVVLLGRLIVALVLPLTSLVVGTAALGQELEDGTAVYLLARPVSRWKVVIAKIAAAWIVIVALVLPSVVASGLIVLADDTEGVIPAFTVAAIVGALAYSAMFVSLSIRFGRALIIGLIYVFVWETLISQFISGVRFLSIRAYITSLADALADSSAQLFNNSLSMTSAVSLLTVVGAFSLWLGIRRLNRYEISERV